MITRSYTPAERNALHRFRFGRDATRPVLVTTAHDAITWDCLLMPCRISA